MYTYANGIQIVLCGFGKLCLFFSSSNEAFSARVELAALDNNFHLFRRVIPERGKKTYSKRSKNWKIQSVKEEKSYKYWLLLGSRILKRRVDDKEAVTRHIEVPANHPKNIAPSHRTQLPKKLCHDRGFG